jgi:hypothetical protein
MNRVLLDTRVLLWANAAPERIGSNTSRPLHAAEELLVSSVSAAEIAVKRPTTGCWATRSEPSTRGTEPIDALTVGRHRRLVRPRPQPPAACTGHVRVT